MLRTALPRPWGAFVVGSLTSLQSSVAVEVKGRIELQADNQIVLILEIFSGSGVVWLYQETCKFEGTTHAGDVGVHIGAVGFLSNTGSEWRFVSVGDARIYLREDVDEATAELTTVWTLSHNCVALNQARRHLNFSAEVIAALKLTPSELQAAAHRRNPCQWVIDGINFELIVQEETKKLPVESSWHPGTSSIFVPRLFARTKLNSALRSDVEEAGKRCQEIATSIVDSLSLLNRYRVVWYEREDCVRQDGSPIPLFQAITLRPGAPAHNGQIISGRRPTHNGGAGCLSSRPRVQRTRSQVIAFLHGARVAQSAVSCVQL